MQDERGVVAEYDDHAGFGWVDAADGRRLWFHCTQIADGSRHIEAGTDVRFHIVAGHLGRWEAAGLQVVEDQPRQGTASR
jgi:cold shock CspA family protein